MKKLLILTTALLLFLSGTNAQILYKISGKGLNKPSYIVGTHHITPSTFADSISGMSQVMEDVSQVYGEVVMSDLSKPATTRLIQKLMYLPEGKTIKDYYTDEEIKDIYNFIHEASDLDMSNPLVESQIVRLTPLALSSQMETMLSMKLVSDCNPADGIDGYFQKKAIEMGKKVGGLETVDFQIKITYGENPKKGCKDLLCAARNIEFQKKLTIDIISAYRRQDIQKIEEAFNRKMGKGCDMDEEFLTKFIKNRNHNWVKIMPKIMKESPTLFAVGVGHLFGKEGVVSLLKKKGYTVEPVK